VSLARRAGPSESAGGGVLVWVLAPVVFPCTAGWPLPSACPWPPRLSLSGGTRIPFCVVRTAQASVLPPIPVGVGGAVVRPAGAGSALSTCPRPGGVGAACGGRKLPAPRPAPDLPVLKELP